MKGKTCCVTGYRDLPQNEINKIKTALAHEIDAAVTDGFTCFMSGFADGVDQYFAELVLERKQTTPALELIAVIPYRKRLDSLNKKTRTRELLDYVQSLYEKKLATYPRTDSQYLTKDMQATAASLILWLRDKMPFGKGYAGEPDIDRVTDDSKVTDHHAIIPTVEIARTDLSELPSGERDVLTL